MRARLMLARRRLAVVVGTVALAAGVTAASADGNARQPLRNPGNDRPPVDLDLPYRPQDQALEVRPAPPAGPSVGFEHRDDSAALGGPRPGRP